MGDTPAHTMGEGRKGAPAKKALLTEEAMEAQHSSRVILRGFPMDMG